MPFIDDGFWEGEREKLIEILLPIFTRIATSAAETAFEDLNESLSIGVDWAVVNTRVQEWARTYTYNLVNGINSTTRDYLQATVSEWISSGQPLNALEAALEPMFGPVRAQMIAATEVTRAFAEGNQETWKQSGVVDGIKWMTAEDELVCPICSPLDGRETDLGKGFSEGPPAHPNCRCYLQPVVRLPE